MNTNTNIATTTDTYLQPVISPSILSADFGQLTLDCEMVLNGGADRLHCDIMDGHFVPNISFGVPIIKSLSKSLPNAKLDCHLMVSHPNRWIKPLAQSGATGFTFHIEAVSKQVSQKHDINPFITVGNVVSNDIQDSQESDKNYVDVSAPESINRAISTLQSISDNNMMPGLAIKPNTPIGDWLWNILDTNICKLLLIMTVEPGFGGQSFMHDQMDKVTQIRQKYPKLEIQVDGGLSEGTIQFAAKAGANNIVAGSYIFKHPRPFVAINNLLKAFSQTSRSLVLPLDESSPLPKIDPSKWKTINHHSNWVEIEPLSNETESSESSESSESPKDVILITKRFVTKGMEYLFETAQKHKSTLLIYNSLNYATFESMKPLLPRVTKIFTVGRIIDSEMIEQSPNLSRIATYSIGTDHIDLKTCITRGIQVKNLKDISNSCANATLTLLLAVLRRLNEAQRAVTTGSWHPWISEYLCSKIQLENATIGCIGLGGIGYRFATIMNKAWNCKILYHTRNQLPAAKEADINATWCPNLNTLLTSCDVLSLHCPLTPETDKIIDKKAISSLKPGTIILNTARGGVIDQDALIEALKSGHIGGAGLDVMTPEPLPPRHPLLNFPNVVVTPHYASAEYPTRLAGAIETIDNLF